jgi:hypothetical protein
VRKPRSAEQKLGGIVSEFLGRAPHYASDWERYRRRLRALLREREYRVLFTLDQCRWENTLDNRNAVGDAVLGRKRK